MPWKFGENPIGPK